MNVNNVIRKLKIMLRSQGLEVKMAEATLVDGTEVYTEGELEVGAVLFIRAGEGVSEDPFAPAGLHETTDGLIVTVGENGEITDIKEDSGAEAVEAVEEVEIEMEEEEEPTLVIDQEELIEAIAEMLVPQIETVQELKKDIEELTLRLEKMAAQPGAPKVTTNTFKEILEDKNSKMEAKLNMLRSLRK